MMMMMRWRASATPAVAVARRPLWSQLASRALSTSPEEDEEEEETTDAQRRKQRVFTDAQRKRYFAAKAKQAREREPREFELLPSALRAFHQSTGHFIVPRQLRCVSAPEESTDALRKDVYTRVYGRVQDSSEIDWPEDVLAQELNIGWALSKLMKNANHRQNNPGVVSGLRAIGFPVEEAAKDWRLFVWNHQTLPALEKFHKLKGHAMVPAAFVVPHGDPLWPETLWGLPLGRRVSMVRHQISMYAPQQLVDLERLGFSFNVSQTEWDTRIKPCFKIFAKENGGHCRIPQKFLVPSQAPWPPEVWGMKLGNVVSHIRAQNSYAKQVAADASLLKSLGFQPSMLEYMWNERILPSLEVFKQVYAHCDVGQKFVVPSESPWPEEAWGDNLGVVVSNIRSYDDYAPQIAKDADLLDAIGFVWNSSNHKWTNVVLPALEMYFKKYGDTQIRRMFVVPSEDPWPEASWGCKLGNVVLGIKHKGTFAKQRQQDHARVQAIGLD